MPKAPLSLLPVPASAIDDRNYVTALSRGLQVLACFRQGDQWLGNQALAQRSGLPKSTISRLTFTLTHLGYLHHDAERSQYRLGMASMALAGTALSQLDIRPLAHPGMQELADTMCVEVALGARDGRSMLYLELCRSVEMKVNTLNVGMRMPLAPSSMGRAWFAAASEEERACFLQLLHQQFPETVVDMEQRLQQASDEYCELGVSCSFGDWRPTVHAIARAFQPGGGLPTMVINCGGPAFRVSKQKLMQDVRPRLIELTQKLEGVLLQ